MKKVFLFLLIAFLWVGANAQTVLYQDDMETYTVGGYLAAQNSTWWTTWENLPGTAQDALIANTFSHSTSKSFKVSKSSSSTDLIMKLGNKTSGAYELNWWMYIENNKDAYYNLQHFQSPGIEWAYEIYFYGTAAANNGTLMVGGDTTTKFSYPKATWFPVRQKINLDKDSIELYINNVFVKKWPFSYQASGTTGTLQLGGVDFYADQTYYTYYVDDVSFTQMGAATVPGIKVNPTSINTGMTQGGTQSVPLAIGDTGTGQLDYNVITIYDSIQDLGLTPTTAILNYDGDNASAIGFNNVPITASVAAKYLNAMTVADAGMKITSVDVFINDLNSSGSNLMTLKIWGMGQYPYEPGALLYQQDFTPAGASWEHIVLNTPVFVSGEDIWVGYTFTQTTAGMYIPGTDGGPNDPNGDYIKTGVAWEHLSANPALAFNWNIRANLEGVKIPHWLSVAPSSGSAQPGETDTLQVTMQNNVLTPGTYTGRLVIQSNDPDHGQMDIPVTFNVYGVGVNDINASNVSVYPNPAIKVININSSEAITGYKVIDLNGKTVASGNGTSVNVSNLGTGVYVLQATTAKGVSTMRFVKK